MLELKGWAINSGRKCHFPGEFFTQDKKGERQRNEAKGWFLTTLNRKEDFCVPEEETQVRGEVIVQVGKLFVFGHCALLLLF